MNSFKDKIAKYVNSIFFPITIALLALATWICKSNVAWVFLIIYMLLCFTPLFCSDGRGYLPLLFYTLIIVNNDIHFLGGIPSRLIISIIFITVSSLIFLIVKKPKMITGVIFYLLLALFIVFLVSYFNHTLNETYADRTGILYLLTFFIILIIYILNNSMLGRNESMQYYATTITFFALMVSAEVIIELIRTSGIDLTSENFSLGWSYTKDTASTFLTLSLPFFSLLINQKKIFYFLSEVFILLALFLLSTDTGLIALLFFSIPLLILAVKNYGKASPYIICFSLLLLGTTFALLMSLNSTFNQRLTQALSCLNFLSEDNININKGYIDTFLTSPIIGTSINTFINKNGTLSLAENTYISTLIMGGSISIAIYAVFDIYTYVTILRKKSYDRPFIFIFMIMIELMGLTSNTIYNIAILIFTLITLSVYQQSNREEEIIIHQDFYIHFDKDVVNVKNINSK